VPVIGIIEGGVESGVKRRQGVTVVPVVVGTDNAGVIPRLSVRAAFDSLLAGATPGESSEKILMAQRRAAYRSMSHIWGVQTDLQYFSAMVMRSQSSDAVDYVNIGAQRGIRRLRPDSQFTLYGYRRDPNGPEVTDETSIALDAEAANRYGMPVLPGFSSNPLPEVEKVELPSGWVLYNTVGREIGPTATVDCTFGRVHRNQSYSIDVDGRRYWNLTFSHIRKPVATSVLELLVHRPSFPKIRPELIVHQHQEGDLSMEAARRAMQFPVDERITNEGRADKVSLSDLPGHSEIIRFAANAAGWDLGEFDVYRFRMSYPIMFSATRMFFYLD
jgi:hypothetical protein